MNGIASIMCPHCKKKIGIVPALMKGKGNGKAEYTLAWFRKPKPANMKRLPKAAVNFVFPKLAAMNKAGVTRPELERMFPACSSVTIHRACNGGA